MAASLKQTSATTLVLEWSGMKNSQSAAAIITNAAGSGSTVATPTSSATGWSCVITGNTAAITTACYDRLLAVLSNFV